jgi:hypothetical protein
VPRLKSLFANGNVITSVSDKLVALTNLEVTNVFNVPCSKGLIKMYCLGHKPGK